jgi:outer membrane cobalamin receptor
MLRSGGLAASPKAQPGRGRIRMKTTTSGAQALAGLGLGALSMTAFDAGAQAVDEEIVVYGTQIEESIPQDLSRYGNRVEIVTAEDIEERGYVDVTQTLQMLVPGLFIRPKNGQFDYFDASLQGSRNQEILWLIDGVRITNRLYNGTSPLDTVPAHMIERIEVLKGGQGIFYGTQAVGGVVNIVTKEFRNEPGGDLRLGLNSNDGYGVSGYYRAGAGDHQFVAYASQDQADGYLPYRDSDLQPSATDRERGYDVSMVGFKYGYNVSDRARLSLQYQHTENELDWMRPFLNYSTFNARDEDIWTLKYDWQASDTVGLFVKAYTHYWDTDYTEIFNVLDANGNVTGDLNVEYDRAYWGYEDYGLNAMAKFEPGGNFDYVLGFDHQNFSGWDDVWRIGALEETVNAVFGQVRTTPMFSERTTLALGLRRNEPSNTEASTVWNLSGQHNLNDNLFVRATLGTSFRLPDAEALFLNEYYDADNDGIPDDGYFAIGNPNLKPEKSRNINLSIGGNYERFSYELIYYTRDITDYIDSYVPIVIAGVEGESFVNSDDEVNVDGLELISTFTINPSWALTASLSRSNSELNNDGIQLTGIPDSEIKLRADYSPQRAPYGLSLTVDRVGDINARRGVVRGDYTVADLSAFYYLGDRREHQLVLRIENLTDEIYSSRVDRGTLDVGGSTYLYDNLGMRRTVHASYSRRF